MDGQPVKGEPSENISISRLFIDMFPQYLAMGMTYDEYWRGPAWLVKAYREAKSIRMHDEEWSRWRQGAYIYEALLCVAPALRALSNGKVGEYSDEPWPLTEEEARECEERREIENYERALAKRRKESAEAIKRMKEAKTSV